MSVFKRSESVATSTRELRRLAHATVVPTTYTSLPGVSERVGPDAPSDERATGYAEGYAEGYARGAEAARADVERERREEASRRATALAALEAAASEVREAGARARDELFEAASRVAFALVEELLAHELSVSLNPGRDALVRTLAADEGSGPATAYLNPEDLARLGEVATLHLGREVTLVADAAVARGGARVEIGDTVLDGQITTALERVREVLARAGVAGATGDRAA